MKYFKLILYVILATIFGWWWYFTFTYVPTATMIYNNNGTDETYEIAYKYSTLIIKNVEDSAYIFYDENGKSLIIIEDVEWNNITIKKD